MIYFVIKYEISTYLNYYLDLWSPIYYLSQAGIVERIQEVSISQESYLSGDGC